MNIRIYFWFISFIKEENILKDANKKQSFSIQRKRLIKQSQWKYFPIEEWIFGHRNWRY